MFQNVTRYYIGQMTLITKCPLYIIGYMNIIPLRSVYTCIWTSSFVHKGNTHGCIQPMSFRHSDTVLVSYAKFLFSSIHYWYASSPDFFYKYIGLHTFSLLKIYGKFSRYIVCGLYSIDLLLFGLHCIPTTAIVLLLLSKLYCPMSANHSCAVGQMVMEGQMAEDR